MIGSYARRDCDRVMLDLADRCVERPTSNRDDEWLVRRICARQRSEVEDIVHEGTLRSKKYDDMNVARRHFEVKPSCKPSQLSVDKSAVYPPPTPPPLPLST